MYRQYEKFVYHDCNDIQVVYNKILSLKSISYDFTILPTYSEMQIKIDITYTPGYSKSDAYGVTGKIVKVNEKFVFIYNIKKNILDIGVLCVVPWFSIITLYAIYEDGFEGSIPFLLAFCGMWFIIFSLLWMRHKVLQIINVFIDNKMK